MAIACRFLRVAEGTLRYWRAGLVFWLSEQTDRPRAVAHLRSKE